MQSPSELTKNQNRIYEMIVDLQAETREKRALVYDKKVREKSSGCFIILTHPREVEDRADQIAYLVGTHIKATLYGRGEAHTTVASHNVSHGINPQLHAHAFGTLALLSGVVARAVNRLRRERIEIDFTRVVHTDQNVLALGQPNDAFWKFALLLKEEADTQGIFVDLPWGASMTLARFTEDVEGERVQRLSEALDCEPPPGLSHPTHVRVGHNTWWGTDIDAACGPFCTHATIALT